MTDRAPGGDLLTIGCGNSTVTCLHHTDGRRLSLPAGAFDRGALQRFVMTAPVGRCLVAAVVATVLADVEAALRDAGLRAEVAGRDHPCPLRLAYSTPATLGVDRWLGALAAHRRCGRAIVVDCGTATTVNLVEADGTFRGGAIAPGLAAIVAGMAVRTPALPAPALDAEVALPAQSTQACVDAGVALGYVGMVEHLVSELVRSSSAPLSVIVTGGNAARFLRRASLVAEHRPDLIHEGLALLAEAPPCAS